MLPVFAATPSASIRCNPPRSTDWCSASVIAYPFIDLHRIAVNGYKLWRLQRHASLHQLNNSKQQLRLLCFLLQYKTMVRMVEALPLPALLTISASDKPAANHGTDLSADQSAHSFFYPVQASNRAWSRARTQHDTKHICGHHTICPLLAAGIPAPPRIARLRSDSGYIPFSSQ